MTSMPFRIIKKANLTAIFFFALGFVVAVVFVQSMLRTEAQKFQQNDCVSFRGQDLTLRQIHEPKHSSTESNLTGNHNGNDKVTAHPPMLNFTKPNNPKNVSLVWQVQEGKYGIYLYSAFYDDRPGLDSVYVRVLSIAEKDVTNISCLIWHNNKSNPSVVPGSKSDIGQQINRYGKGYRQNLFSCKVPSSEIDKPEYVSIITHFQQKPTNLIKIHYPEKPPADQVIEFGHCLSVRYWKHDPKGLVEWVEMQKLWGVKEFNVYASSLDLESRYVFEKYPTGTVINLYELPDIFSDGHRNSIRLNMSPSINDCMYRNMYRYKYVVCTDTDELIVPLLDDNYSDLVKRIMKKHKVKHPFPSFEFRNVYFFTDLGAVDNSSTLFTQRYLEHLKPSQAGYSPKSFTSPQACAGLQNHFCWQRIPKYDYHGWTTHIDTSIGMSFHYKMCHFDEYLHKPGHCANIMKNHTTNERMKHFSHVEEEVKNIWGILKLA